MCTGSYREPTCLNALAHIVNVTSDDAIYTRDSFQTQFPNIPMFPGSLIAVQLFDLGEEIMYNGVSTDVDNEIKYWASLMLIWTAMQRNGLLEPHLQLSPEVAQEMTDNVFLEMEQLYNVKVRFYV